MSRGLSECVGVYVLILFYVEPSGEVHEEDRRDVRPEPSHPNSAQNQKTPFQPRQHEVGFAL